MVTILQTDLITVTFSKTGLHQPSAAHFYSIFQLLTNPLVQQWGLHQPPTPNTSKEDYAPPSPHNTRV